MNSKDKKGIYVHIPFCKSKCHYCDFCSVVPSGDIIDRYVDALKREAEGYKRKNKIKADTVYFGGGTPSFIGAERLSDILLHLRKVFDISPDAEITAECNPSSCGGDFFSRLIDSGFNRISLGLQSADPRERKAIGRLTDADAAKQAALNAKKAGFNNISLDLMLGLPFQNTESLKNSIDFCADAGVTHVSAYILKAEEGTPFYEKLSIEGAKKMNLPDEDAVCDLYLFAAEYLQEKGFEQYEISNFCKKGHISRHNYKYWNLDEYIGLGVSAHSFFEGKRFFNTRDIDEYIKGSKPIPDGSGGDFEEYLMLRLRLAEGLIRHDTERRFGKGCFEKVLDKAKKYKGTNLLNISEDSISLTKRGFLVSNTIIAELSS